LTPFVTKLTWRLPRRHQARFAALILKNVSLLVQVFEILWAYVVIGVVTKKVASHRGTQVWHALSRDYTVLPALPNVYPRME